MKNQSFEAEYLRREGDRAIIHLIFDGAPMPMDLTFPYSAIEKAGIKKGSKFILTPTEEVYEITLSNKDKDTQSLEAGESRYLRREGDKAIAESNLDGLLIKISLPYSAIEKAGLKEGNAFRCAVREEYDIKPSEIKPWTKEQKERFRKFLKKSICIHKQRLESGEFE